MTALTLDEAEDHAARTLAAIDDAFKGWGQSLPQYAADRERVASDLAGLREHQPGDYPDECGVCLHVVDEDICPDARRYLDGLRRTAALYGVRS